MRPSGPTRAATWRSPGAAGFRVVVLSSVWQRPRTAPTPAELEALARAIDAAEPRRDPADRRRVLVRLRHAADATRPGGVHRVRGRDPARLPAAPHDQHRQRAELERLLAAAVRPRGLRCAAPAYFKLLAEAVPGAQGARPAGVGDRRVARGARRRPARRRSAPRTPRRGSSKTSGPPTGRAVSQGPRSTSSRSTPTPSTRLSLRRSPTRARPRSGSPTTRGSSRCSARRVRRVPRRSCTASTGSRR